MTDDPHGRKSNNPVWTGDLHGACDRRIHELEAELATARTVTRRLVGFCHYDALEHGVPQWPDAERAWLASVSPPTSGDTLTEYLAAYDAAVPPTSEEAPQNEGRNT